MNASPKIDSVESLYEALVGTGENIAKARLMLLVRNWITEVSCFDPVSGQAMHTGLIDFMDVVSKSMNDQSLNGETKDRVHRIVSHTNEAVLAIIENTRDKILREHAMLPIHAAREVDSTSVQWLSRQPGRTLREKLSSKPYIKAVRRKTSVDTAENRLLKTFICRLEQILIKRQNTLAYSTEDTCEKLLVCLQRWRRDKDAAEIRVWGNLPPNNTILQDKRYRKVWDGWIWLQDIDDQILEDSKRIQRHILGVIYWNTLSLLNHTGRFRTVQQPIGLDYDKFSISPELPIKGYLFPNNSETTLVGLVDKLDSDRGFGFIDGCFFHASDLKTGLHFDELQVGEQLLFEVEETPKGKRAKQLRRGTNIPKLITFESSNKQINISIDEETISVLIDTDYIVLIQKTQNTKKKLKIEPATIKEIPKTILSLVTDSHFYYSEPKDNQSDLMQIDSSVVDLCSIRPKFTNHTGSQANLPFRLLLQQWPLNVNGRLEIDCGSTKAITLNSDIETVSMRSLFLHSSTLSDADKSSASMFFTKKLSDYIKTKRLTYLVPDWGNDFDMEVIRKSVNFYFEESTPLPKSIAAIFAWQSSKKFKQDNVRENDFVLVVDAFDGGISVTPVQAIYQKELGAILPETQGISWERHPTVIVENRNIHAGMVRNLATDGCQISEELIQLFGFDGLASDAGAVSFVKDEHWYHLPDSIREVLDKNLDINILSNNTIRNCLNSTNRDCRGVHVFILPLEDTINKPELRKDYNWLGSAWSPIKGCQTLNSWQEDIDDINLWRDHLPELSIKIVRDGHFENFYLVKDATVTPQRDRTVDIPVEEYFTLPAGQTHYSFPLQQGEGSKELQFVAYLKSPAFPLKEDTACKLKMTYTYGADDPYELKFIPLDSEKACFKSIRVEWRSALDGKNTDIKTLPVPPFPKPLNWMDFYEFKSNQGNPIDVYNEINNLSNYVADIANYISFAEGASEVNLSSRSIGIVEAIEERETDGKMNVCGRISYDNRSIQFKWGPRNINQGDEVSFDIKTKGRFSNANRISKGRRLPRSYSNRLKNELSLHLKRIMAGHEHALGDPLCPSELQNSIQCISSNFSAVLSCTKDIALQDSVYLVYACLKEYCPSDVGQTIAKLINNDIERYWEHAAYCIGNSSVNWQNDVFGSIIQKANSKKYCSLALVILSIALWRSKELVNKLTEEELGALNQNLYDCLHFELQKLINDVKSFQIANLCKHLELLLALLRSRGNEDDNFKMILAPEKKQTKDYVILLDDITRQLIEKKIKLKSRISLQIKKPDMFRNTPDLLYALRMYLTGDSGANTIVITGVSDEDQY